MVAFKQYQRGVRQQVTDLSYTQGMAYTQKPLQTGFNRRIINYDFMDSGAGLRARPGLKATDTEIVAGADAVLLNSAYAKFDINESPIRANSLAGFFQISEKASLFTPYPNALYSKYTYAGFLKLYSSLSWINAPTYNGLRIGRDPSASAAGVMDYGVFAPLYDYVTKEHAVLGGLPSGKNIAFPRGGYAYEFPMLINGLCIRYDADAQEYTISGHTLEDNVEFAIGQMMPNNLFVTPTECTTSLLVSGAATIVGTDPQVVVTQNLLGDIAATDYDVPNTVTIDTAAHITLIMLRFPNSGTTVTDLKIKVQVELGAVATAWEAFVGSDAIAPTFYDINGVPFATAEHMIHTPNVYCFDDKFAYITLAYDTNIPAIGDGGQPITISGYKFQLAVGNAVRNSTPAWNANEIITPKTLTPSEASMWGYNMLADNPYSFANGTGNAVIALTGILPYTADGLQIALTPKVNQTITLECFYDATTPGDYKVKFEWKDIVSATWTTIATVDPDARDRFRCTFTNPGREIFIRATAIKTSDSSEPSVIAAGFNFSPTTKPVNFENYYLASCRKMVFWNHRLCLYDLPGQDSIMFLSDLNDISYFPYPNNMEDFGVSIRKIIPYQNDLLVFTLDSVYLISLNSDGLTWTKTLIQGGLEISALDAEFITSIKSFVMFKSGHYFYLIVPSSSIAGTLTIAPISAPIQELLDNLDTFFTETLTDLFAYTGAYNLVQFRTYQTLDEIHIVFSLTLDDDTWVHVDLIYSTLKRNWRTYVFESQGMILPYISDITQGPQIITQSAEDPTHLQYYQFDKTLTNCNDDLATVYNNIQLLDTGYRDLSVEFKKRFREFQYLVYVEDPTILKFSTAFYIDGIIRKAPTALQGELTPDPEEPGRYLLFITDEPIYDLLPNILAPDNPAIPEEYWQLDVTDFGRKFSVKVRQQVAGKGFAGRLVIKANNTVGHELLHNAWVFRLLNSR